MLDTDDFNRADSTTNPGSTLGGRAWTADRGVFGIVSNKLYTSTPSGVGQGAVLETDFGKADGAVQIDLPALTVNSIGCGLVFRFSDINNYWDFQLYRSSAGVAQWFLTKTVAGTGTDIASGTRANNNAATVRVEFTGSTIKAYIDGSLITTQTDSALASNTKHGALIDNSNGLSLDNFSMSSPTSLPSLPLRVPRQLMRS